MTDNDDILIHISKTCLNWFHPNCKLEYCECDCHDTMSNIYI